MALITTIIPPQAYEVIRDRIYAILQDEIKNQQTLSGDTETINFFIERSKPVQSVEMPAIVVSFAEADYETKTIVVKDGKYLYNIDVWNNSREVSGVDGDQLSSLDLQKLIGKVRFILEHPIYVTLLFPRPGITRVTVQKIAIGNPNQSDMESVIMGRITLLVEAAENESFLNALAIAGADTVANIDTSPDGYQYTAISEPYE